MSVTLSQGDKPTDAPIDLARWTVVALCGFVALTALGGGAALLAAPDGSVLALPTTLLAGSPFHDYRIPGLLLAGVVGLANLAAAVLIGRRHRRGAPVAFVAGGALAVFVVTEMLLLRTIEPLHVGYLGFAMAIQSLVTAGRVR